MVLLGQSPPDSEPNALIDRSFEVFHSITNFSAGVDVQTIDHGQRSSGSVLAKETWRFSREGQVNKFTRNRYLPFRGHEVIESTNYTGGVIVSVTNIPLPAASSLPGFEVCNFLTAMREQSPAIVRNENGTLMIEAETGNGTKSYAWFALTTLLPNRLEKRKAGEIILAYTRSQNTASFLPDREVFHFYEAGQIKSTVIRSFSSIKEKFVSTNSSSTEPKLKSNTP